MNLIRPSFDEGRLHAFGQHLHAVFPSNTQPIVAQINCGAQVIWTLILASALLPWSSARLSLDAWRALRLPQSPYFSHRISPPIIIVSPLHYVYAKSTCREQPCAGATDHDCRRSPRVESRQ